jgi:hypothetical protein
MVVDPLVISHRELRVALLLSERELRRSTLTPRRARLLSIVRRTLEEAQLAAIVGGAGKMRGAALWDLIPEKKVPGELVVMRKSRQ